MSISCQVILNPGMTPGQLAALGAALWRWCTRSAGGTGIYRYLDNQALADLIAGRLPVPDPATRPAGQWGVRFGVRDGAFPDRRALIDSLRREIPTAGVEDVLADGTSWTGAETKAAACLTPQRSDGAGRPERCDPAGRRVSGRSTLNPEGSP
jgi:hypothetical protein